MKTRDKTLILSAGMPRSGSTLLYNIVRLVLAGHRGGAGLLAGWIGDVREAPRQNVNLIKIHLYEENLAGNADCIFYSYRDVRDAILSAQRMFGLKPSIKRFEVMITHHEHWMRHCDRSFEIDELTGDTSCVARQVEDIMCYRGIFGKENVLDESQVLELCHELEIIGYQSEGDKNENYHLTNQYHKGHITDGRSGLWRERMDPELLQQVAEKYGWWFEKYGFPQC